jgi:HK97 gp10 family phage protein
MPGSYFRIDGVRELRQVFRKLPAVAAKKVVRKALRTALKPIATDARSRAPVVTGAMRDAIKVRAKAKRKRGYIGLEIRVGTHNFMGKTFYAGFQELGTRRMRGRHFMENAFNAGSAQAAETIKRMLLDGIVTEAAKLRGKR